ncbi:MAG: MarR family transcriptional regulator [Dongiaceae bacterium]
MSDARTGNLLGALALALTDAMTAATEHGARHGAAAPAALVCIHNYPGLSIERLRTILQLSHSGTVRLVDRLVADRLVERAAGPDQRSVALRLTPAGATAVAAVLAERRRVLDEALHGLDAGERGALVPLLEKLLARTSAGRRSADHICRLCDDAACPLPQCPVLD